ncbi:MAG: hypothetical protein ACM3ML_00300 [Micromonosporaceae bacterium]
MAPDHAQTALIDHIQAAAPWGCGSRVETEAVGTPFQAAVDGPAYKAIGAAMLEAYGTPMTTLGQGGSIPLCNVFADTYPDVELILVGVEEPLALIYAPHESRGSHRDSGDGLGRGAIPATLCGCSQLIFRVSVSGRKDRAADVTVVLKSAARCGTASCRRARR